MPTHTKIAWTDASWNPVRGCSRVSAGCINCYAERVAWRFGKQPGQPYHLLVQMTSQGPKWTGKLTLHPELLDWPLRKKKPLRIFVNSMSDLFHEEVPDEFILRVFDVMRQSANGFAENLNRLVATHTFQILTKRPGRMLNFCSRLRFEPNGTPGYYLAERGSDTGSYLMHALRNVWLGVSVEDQATAETRIPLLLRTPAALRFVSYEPALEPVDFTRLEYDGLTRIDGLNGLHGWPSPHAKGPRIDWLIIGGESGSKARPFYVEWARSTVQQCKKAGVPVFIKQIGSHTAGWCLGNGHGEPEFYVDCQAWEASEGAMCEDGRCACRTDRAGADPTEWPADLRIREFPKGVDPHSRDPPAFCVGNGGM